MNWARTAAATGPVPAPARVQRHVIQTSDLPARCRGPRGHRQRRAVTPGRKARHERRGTACAREHKTRSGPIGSFRWSLRWPADDQPAQAAVGPRRGGGGRAAAGRVRILVRQRQQRFHGRRRADHRAAGDAEGPEPDDQVPAGLREEDRHPRQLVHHEHRHQHLGLGVPGDLHPAGGRAADGQRLHRHRGHAAVRGKERGRAAGQLHRVGQGGDRQLLRRRQPDAAGQLPAAGQHPGAHLLHPDRLQRHVDLVRPQAVSQLGCKSPPPAGPGTTSRPRRPRSPRGRAGSASRSGPRPRARSPTSIPGS